PASSVAVHVTVAVPIAKTVPDEGVHVPLVVNSTVAPVGLVAFTAIGDGSSSTGGVASRLIVTEAVAGPPALVAVHVRVVPSVSVEIVCGVQPELDAISDCGSLTSQDTATSLVYQPFVPGVPSTCATITGGVGSPANTANVPSVSDVPQPPGV